MTTRSTGLQEWRDGWGVVLAAAVGVAVGGIIYHFVGTLIKPFEEAYGWGRGEVALGLTLITFLNPLCNLIAGACVDRYGARPVGLVGGWGYGLGIVLMGLAGPSLWTWYAACIAFALLHTFVSSVVWTSLVVKRFNRQRGLALAMSLIGGGIMVAITPMLVVWLTGLVGLRGVFYTIGIAGALIIFIPTWLFFREAPQQTPMVSEGQPSKPAVPLTGLTPRQALVAPRYWQLSLALFLVACCIGTFMVHIQPMLTDSGLSPGLAATIALFMGPSMIVGRLSTGMLFDYVDARIVSGVAFLLPVVACALLMNLDGGYLMAAAAGIFIGLSMGAEIDVVAYLTSRYFGVKHYGMLFAILISIYQVGVGVGSVVSGAFYDIFKSYDTVLIILILCCIAAAILVAAMGRPPGEHARH